MHLRALIVTCLCVYCTNLFADDSQWRQCGRQPSKHQPTTPPPSTPEEVSNDSRRVHMFRFGQDVHADRVQYSEKGKKAVATGNVLLRDPDLDMTSEKVDYRLDDETARAENVRYWYHPSHGSGTADVAERVSQEVVNLENTTYSTCDFEDRDWELKAGDATLDREKGVGYARNVTAKFKGVPFFYTPWMSFPLNDERKTGFLAPVFGRSSNSGIDIETPFYWNIAPDYDALFRPRYLSKRGLLLGANARYLNENNYGEANIEYLDDDDFNDDRYLVSLKHKHDFTDHFTGDFLYNKASDDEYFEDLGDTLGITSTQRLERRGDLRYRANHFGGSWNGLVRLRQFQIVDSDRPSSSDPYKVLPQIRISNSFSNLPAGFEISNQTRWVNFDHDDRVEGSRLHLATEISRPWTTPGFFIEPAMRWMHTSYDLNNLDTTTDDDPSRTLPSFSLDSGLIFERDIASWGTRHTIEPRLFYLYTPSRNHEDIPLFDTGEYEFSFSQLYRKDRFSNPDRVADANQLTAAITSRFLSNQSGSEILRASLGTIFYFDDLDVTLNNTEEIEDNTSDIVGELAINFDDRWQAIAAALWNPQDDQFNRTNVNLQYRSNNNFIFNIGHRFRRDDFDQTDISFIYPVSDQWRAVGRWNYDLRESRDLDLLGGIEYDTCCWKLRFAARRFTNDDEGDYNNSIEVQLTLKGLTSIGSPVSDQLQRSIRGYEERNTYTN